jgi:hypothetical protein
MKLRMLVPPPVPISVGRDFYRVGLMLIEKPVSGYVAAFIGPKGYAHIKLSDVYNTPEDLEKAWATGFDCGTGNLAEPICAALVNVGSAEQMS